MPRLIWAPGALGDIDRLYVFLAAKNPRAANRAVATVREAVKLLQRHPEAGRPAPDQPPDRREWPIPFGDGGYVALYRFDGEAITILFVKHGRELR